MVQAISRPLVFHNKQTLKKFGALFMTLGAFQSNKTTAFYAQKNAMTSWTSEHCSWKSNCTSRSHLAQQLVDPARHLSWHLKLKQSTQRPCFYPFWLIREFRVIHWRDLAWVTLWPSCMNHLSLIVVYFPPGFECNQGSSCLQYDVLLW